MADALLHRRLALRNLFAILADMFPKFLVEHRKFIIVLGAVVFVLAAAVLVAWKAGKLSLFFTPSISTPNTANLPPIDSSGPAENPTINVLPLENRQVPTYQGRPVHVMEADPEVLKQIPPETHQKSKTELADLAVKLADNPRRPDDWMRVAFIKRFYHDYLGARDAYEYLNILNAGDPVPFYNLGSLYGYYLKEPAQAVPKFEEGLQLDPANVSFYTGLADFYREVMNDPPSAEKVLFRGLAKVPADANLLIALGAFYKITGDIPKAVEYYEKVLAVSTLANSERPRITAELEQLKQSAAH